MKLWHSWSEAYRHKETSGLDARSSATNEADKGDEGSNTQEKNADSLKVSAGKEILVRFTSWKKNVCFGSRLLEDEPQSNSNCSQTR